MKLLLVHGSPYLKGLRSATQHAGQTDDKKRVESRIRKITN